MRLTPRLLRTRSRPIRDVGEIKRVTRGLLEVMGRYGCHGLAAVQCGVPVALFVAEIPPSLRELVRVVAEKTSENYPPQRFGVFANVRIESATKERRYAVETCVSYPKHAFFIPRPHTMRVAFDTIEPGEGGDGGALTRLRHVANAEVSGFHTHLFEHEIDHLNGIPPVDRHVNPLTVRDEDLSETERQEKSGYLDCVVDPARGLLKEAYFQKPQSGSVTL